MLPGIHTFQERFGEIRWFMAPMAGISDIVFRSLIREMGAQIVVSELVSAEGLVRGGKKTRELAEIGESERPVGLQIFGSSVETLSQSARIVQEIGADFVDVNFGCPVKKVVCDGGGAAWLRDPMKLEALLKAMKAEIRVPLTIKIRTGWDEGSINAHEVVDAAARAGVAWVAIHGRTRAQGYSGHADWELIRQVAVKSPIPIVGNGDVLTAKTAKRRLDEGYCHAVMIGRGALKNPWIFREILGTHDGNFDLAALVNRHFELALAHKGRERAFLSLKKFLAWYAAGYRGASVFRASLFTTRDVDELRALALGFFENVRHAPVLDESPFLMGGHG